MELFYCPELSASSGSVTLSAEESHHARRVFRKRSGEPIELTNGKGLRSAAIITDSSSQKISCKIESIQQIPSPPERNIHIAMAAIRPNRMDWAVEKLTELGVGGIQPLFTGFTSVKAFKSEHLGKIAVSAMKQSRQAYLPELFSPLLLAEYFNQLPLEKDSLRLIAHLTPESKTISQFRQISVSRIVFLIGPEGGFSDAEVILARRHNFYPLKLAGQVLRSETAAVTAAAQAKVYFL
jgi:16S rRNA (uracil1498-N3)-methyltransferase